MTSTQEENDRRIQNAGAKGELFQSDAEDYFLFTKSTFDWNEIKPVVIGRPGYDNYLVTQVHHRHEEISFLDITNAFLVLHQTDASGVLAGHRVAKDKMYNMKLIKRDWQKGRTEFSDWVVEQFPPTTFSIRKRYIIQDIPYDDNYLQEEIHFMKQLIKPTDVCVEFARRVIRGVLASYCAKLYVVVYDSSYVFEMQKTFQNTNIEVLYGYGIDSEPGFGEHIISTRKNFTDYLGVVATQGIHFDILINNGRCRPQVAYQMRQWLKSGGRMFLRGSFEHYNVVQTYYSFEREYC